LAMGSMRAMRIYSPAPCESKWETTLRLETY
jgi:hypothetical protein